MTGNLKFFCNILQCIQKPRNVRIYVLRVKYSSNAENQPLCSNKPEDMKSIKYEDFPVSNIRNFSIIAHIDHGKSTLADRLLEYTGTLELRPGTAQVLDRLQVEKERGITVKAVSASLKYRSKLDNELYLLNLIDTPGHVDFSNEVSRSLAACQSVVLLVAANEGVQAQTYANFYLAFFKDLVIIPVLNKIDMTNADPERTAQQMKTLFDIDSKNIVKVSAKLGTGIENLIEEIIVRTPPPKSDRNGRFKGLLFDSWYDKYKGTVILLFVQDGSVKEGDTIVSHCNKINYIVKHIGVVNPNEIETGILNAGQIGFVKCNMRSPSEAHIGDTFYLKHHPVEPFPEFKPAQPVVFAGIYPIDQTLHQQLRTAIEQLVLTDSAVTVAQESCPALGKGWRLGFLGLLHLEVFSQRLDQEYDAQVVMTSPSVTYKVVLKDSAIKRFGSKELLLSNPLDLPAPEFIETISEPIVLGTIMSPAEYSSDVISLCMERRGVQENVTYIDNTRVMIQFRLPLNEIIIDFHDKLKTMTSGFASFDYEDKGYVASTLVKMDILLNGKPVDELSLIVHKSNMREIAKKLCLRLTEIISRQQFTIAVQAAVGSTIIARETIKAYRKDVTWKIHGGGDETRKMKLLKAQSEGKRRMRMIGKVEIPRDSFIKLLKK